MKKIIRNIEVVVENTQRQVSLSSRTCRTVWCSICEGYVRMLTPADAAGKINTTDRSIFRMVESGSLHFTELDDGALLICSRSLMDDLNKE